MNKKFTASEVRDIAWSLDGLSRQMLRAYADLLEAQEGAVPVVTRESAINAIEHVGRYNGLGRETEARQMLVEGSPSVAHHAQAQPPAASVADVVRDVLSEVEAAIHKFPTWPNDPLHAVGVLNEECGELNKAVLQHVYEPHKNRPGDVRKEAIQTAAMALRFIAGLPYYVPAPGTQFRQTTLAT